MHRFLSFLVLLLFCPWAWAQTDTGQGSLDAVHYVSAKHELQVSGWAGSTLPNVFVTSMRIDVADATVYRGRMLPNERPDVVEYTGRRDWLTSGFQVQVRLPPSLSSGAQKIVVFIHLSNGKEFVLPATQANQTIQIADQSPPSTAVTMLLWMAMAGPLVAMLALSWSGASCSQSTWVGTHTTSLFGLAVLLSYSILVVTGTTGSSLPLLLQDSSVTQNDAARWLGDTRPIRSDEWEVITPMAISQIAHSPPFPVVNNHYGADGQNMMVIGMTGVPVWHISSLAKPATWGFFFFDLRRALAWYWWFPFFACFAAVWLLLRRFFAMDWRLAAGWSASLALAPYSVGFSGWPAYAVFFPVLCLVVMERLLHTIHVARGLALGGLLGVALSGCVLTLYPAWQISIAYLLTPLALAWFWQQRRTLQFQSAQWAGLALSLGMTTLLLGSWWLDAQEAVHWVRETVYPGQRTTGAGGDIDPWFLIKGLMSFATMYGKSPLMDPSDAGSFIFLFIPTTVCALLAWRQHRSLDTVGIALLGFLGFSFVYLFEGLNPTFAQISLWGMVPTYRIDIAMALAQVLTIGWIFHKRPIENFGTTTSIKNVGIVVSVFTVALGWHLFQKLPILIAEVIPSPMVLVSCLGWGGLSYLLIVRKYGLLTFVFCLWTLSTSLPFNPLIHAPNRVSLNPTLSALIQTNDSNTSAMTAVIGERTWSMILPAVGVPVLNSVHYHPPRKLWKDLDPKGDQSTIYNRYQRLLLKVEQLPQGIAYRINSPRLDEVVLTLDPKRFDFNLLRVTTVITGSSATANLLSGNATLEHTGTGLGWTLFKVVPSK